MKQTLLLLSIALASTSVAMGQALPTARVDLSVQVGGTFSYVRPDYTPQDGLGYGIYSTIDFSPDSVSRIKSHLGAELDFHQISISQHKPAYERTYELGVRYHTTFGPQGRIKPFGKVAFGRGVFNFPATNGSQTSVGNLAYNMFTVAGGLDYGITRSINVRAEAEYQSWFKRPGLENGLTPLLFSIGGAYRFGGKGPDGER